jgi:hypothetical protein
MAKKEIDWTYMLLRGMHDTLDILYDIQCICIEEVCMIHEYSSERKTLCIKYTLFSSIQNIAKRPLIYKL